MQCYTELLPPTAVTHAVALPFLSLSANNLVVAKTSLLQVFNVSEPANGDAKLELIGEYPLAGTVTSIARAKLVESKTGGEAVLLAVKDAKLSLVEWDLENHRISTISIHYYEGDNVVRQPFGPSLAECDSILTVDPRSRCAALKFAERQLAIIPFRQELGGDEEDDAEAEVATGTTKAKDNAQQHTDMEATQTPYKASFVLPLTLLDPALSNTVDLAFLHGYREPTFGILSAPISPSSSLAAERKDILSYMVYTLDLDQRASTHLITTSRLPPSLWKVMPLPNPIHGALLIGLNEFVHIDESGKPNATAVNEFAKLETDFGMADQSDLNMKLEDCTVEILDISTGELLVILNDGSLATLAFQKVGKSISGLKISRIPLEHNRAAVLAAPSCTAKLPNDHFFVGSEDGPSSLITWQVPTTLLSRKRSHAQMLMNETEDLDEDEDNDANEVDDDDLYDAGPQTKKRATSTTMSTSEKDSREYVFDSVDQLHSVGPITSVCVGRSRSTNKDKLTLLAATGRGRSSRLTFLHRDIIPDVKHEHVFENAKNAWTLFAASASPEQSEWHNLMFVYDDESTKAYDVTVDKAGSVVYHRREATEFEEEGETLEMNSLAAGTCLVQGRQTEIRTYDENLGLSQIIPMIDEETDAELNIVHISFGDPFLLVIRDDSSVQVLQVHGKEIEPLEGEGIITEKRWLSGCVYSGILTNQAPALFLLDGNGVLHVFDLPTLKPIYNTSSLPHLPPVISVDAPQRRGGAKEVLAELLVAELGHKGTTQPYLIIRTAMDDLILYEHYKCSPTSAADAWYTNLRFRKVPTTYLPKYVEETEGRPPPLKALLLGDYSVVAIPGITPSLFIKDSSSLPKVLEVRKPAESNKVTTLSRLHQPHCEDGFMLLGSGGVLQGCQLPADLVCGAGWWTHQVDLGEHAGEVRHVAFHEARNLFVVSTYRDMDFYFADEDTRHQDQDDISLRPHVPQYTVHLVSSTSHKILHSYEMPYLDTITSLKVMQLEVSENTYEQALRVVVSSAAQRGEDMPARGTVTVFDIIDVVPDPNIPESGVKLHVVSKEDTKGAVTALDIFPGGLIGTAQGQKIMIRGLKEDGTCLPVAFLDATSHGHTLKTLPQAGMWLLGDVVKGCVFGGFTEEPYKLIVLGRSRTQLEVMAAEFLPFEGLLFILVVDADENLHVLQYDPENPKTVAGRRLVERSTFHLGHFITSMTLLPSSLASTSQHQQQTMTNGHVNGNDNGDETASQLHHVLTTAQSGAIGLITPLEEGTYRRLAALQTHLTSVLEHAAALNPRAYRVCEVKSGYDGGTGARPVVDGSLVRRISELGANRRSDVLSRAGSDAWSLRNDLEFVGGGFLGYL